MRAAELHLHAGAWLRLGGDAEVLRIHLGGDVRPDHAAWVERIVVRRLRRRRSGRLRVDVARAGGTLGTVAVLGRLALAARRSGCTTEVVGGDDALCRVAAAVGLAEVLGLGDGVGEGDRDRT